MLDIATMEENISYFKSGGNSNGKTGNEQSVDHLRRL